MNEKNLIALIPESLFIRIKMLSATRLVTIKSLVIEAITDLLVKYERV